LRERKAKVLRLQWLCERPQLSDEARHWTSYCAIDRPTAPKRSTTLSIKESSREWMGNGCSRPAYVVKKVSVKSVHFAGRGRFLHESNWKRASSTYNRSIAICRDSHRTDDVPVFPHSTFHAFGERASSLTQRPFYSSDYPLTHTDSASGSCPSLLSSCRTLHPTSSALLLPYLTPLSQA
jgi:hypothetical protein